MTSRPRILTLASAVLVAAAAFTFVEGSANTAIAQEQQQPGAGSPPTTNAPVLFDPKDTILLLLDHQTGLFQTVKDIPVAELRANTVVLAKAAELSKAPILTSASEPNGPNGPLMPELATAAPTARFIARKGEISAWDNKDFKAAVKASGRKTLIIAGVWTSVCVAFPAVQAKAEGYNVYYVIDSSGDMNQLASQAALARMTQAGVIPVSTNAVMAEFQRTWARPDAAQWGALYSELVPNYKAATESHQKAQEAAKAKK